MHHDKPWYVGDNSNTRSTQAPSEEQSYARSVASTKGRTPIEHHVDPAKEPIVRTFRVSSQILCEKNARAFCSISASMVVRVLRFERNIHFCHQTLASAGIYGADLRGICNNWQKLTSNQFDIWLIHIVNPPRQPAFQIKTTNSDARRLSNYL